jgi:hypothetical protein
MKRVDYLITAKPELVVDLTLYTTRKLPIALGWGCPCTIQRELGTGWIGYDGWPLLLDGPLSPGESCRVGYVFLSGQKAVEYLRTANKFYLWENGIVGEAEIIDPGNSN